MNLKPWTGKKRGKYKTSKTPLNSNIIVKIRVEDKLLLNKCIEKHNKKNKNNLTMSKLLRSAISKPDKFITTFA